MGWTGSILNGVGGFTAIAANGQGDLQRALGRSVMSKIQLVGDVAINNGVTVDANIIRKMAKYKPFKNATVVFDSFSARNSARAAARYGMAEPTYFYPNTYTIPAAWTYNKPVCGTNPLRVEDFIKDTTSADAGYDPHAVPPLAMEIPGGLKCATTFAALLWKDSYVNNYLASRSTSDVWRSDRSLSIAELLGGGQNNYNSYYVAFVFYRYNSAGTSIEAAELVVTNKKFGDFFVQVFMFYPQGDGTQSGDYVEGGIHYPVIPMLQTTTYVGRKFAVLVCLSNTGPSDPTTYAYQVLPNNYSCIPLGFDADRRWDYLVETASSEKAIDMLTGVLNTGPTLTLVQQHTGGWNEYSCSMWVTADITSASGWQGTFANVHVSAYAPSGMFGGLPGSGSEYGEYTNDVQVSIPAGGQTYTRQLVQLPNVFIYKDAPKEVVVSAKFTQTGNEKAFNNTLTITD